MNKEPSCKFCEPPTRYPGCHSKCEKYLEWKKEIERKKSDFKRVKNEEINYHIYKANQVEKTRRKYDQR